MAIAKEQIRQIISDNNISNVADVFARHGRNALCQRRSPSANSASFVISEVTDENYRKRLKESSLKLASVPSIHIHEIGDKEQFITITDATVSH